MINKILDWIGSFIIILALFLEFSPNWIWLLYSIGCIFYIFLNYRKKLYGQCTLNVLALIIAIKNYIC